MDKEIDESTFLFNRFPTAGLYPASVSNTVIFYGKCATSVSDVVPSIMMFEHVTRLSEM